MLKTKRKKYHLKKRVRVILNLLIIICLINIINSVNFNNKVFEEKITNLIKKGENNKKSKNIITAIIAKSLLIDEKNNDKSTKNYINVKNSDSMFTLKEDKNLTPIVYLYNTHQTEKYLKENDLIFQTNIKTATSYLKEKLEENNIGTIMEEKDISNILNENNWKYSSSYKASRIFLEDAKNKNGSLKYYFDIHRDSGPWEHTSFCIENKCYAKILFLIGLENPFHEQNQAFAEELSRRLNNKLNGISKGILQKQGKNVNGVYNEDFSNNLLLIEIGGENTKSEEVYNTINILSEVLSEYIKEKEGL